MTPIFIIGIISYFLLMALIGYVASRRLKTMEDYVIAGRKLPFYLALPTVVATWFGAGSSMGVSGTVYSQGFYGVIADPFGCSLALLIAGLFFAVPFRRLKLLTISDLLRKAYGATFERVSTFLVLPFYIGTLASQMLAMGYIFKIVSGSSLEIGILIGASIVVTYTICGGMWAVTLTDFVQFSLLAIGVVLIGVICWQQVPDRHRVLDTFLNEFHSVLPNEHSVNWLSYIGRILMTGLGAIMGQDLIQRFLAGRSEAVSKYSGLVGALLYFSLGLIPLFIGIAGREIYPSLEQPEALMPLLAKEFLSPVAFAIFACGLFAAIMSTADSYLLAGTTLAAHNILLKIWPLSSEKSKIAVLRWVNLAIALIALALAFSGQSIFDLMVHSGATLFVAIFVPASAALFWKKANAFAAWSSMTCGILSWLAFILYSFSNYGEQHEELLFAAATIGGGCSLMAYLITTWLFTYARKQSRMTAAAILLCIGLATPLSCYPVTPSEMTLEEKVGQLFMVHFKGSTPNTEATTLIQELHVGGIIYYTWANELSSPTQIASLSSGLQQLAKSNRHPIPLLIATDQEGGRVNRCQQGFTICPSNWEIGETGQPDNAQKCAYIIGRELKAVGINMNLAPVVDINNNPNNPIIGNRSFGNTPEVVTAFGRAALNGYKEAGILSSLKHFPGHGDVTSDSHISLPVINKSVEELQKMELVPFFQLASAADSIMTAHVLIPSLDPHHCATLSKKTLDLLREQAHYDGVIITDSLVMEGVLQGRPVDAIAMEAFNAGCDILLFGGRQLEGEKTTMELTVDDIKRIHQSFLEAVKQGRISEEQINKSVKRILLLKQRINIPGEG